MLSVIHYCVSHVSNFDSIINNVVWSLNMFLVRNHVLFRKAISAIIILSSSFAGLSIISWCSVVFYCLDEWRSWKNCFHSAWVGSLPFRRWQYFLPLFLSDVTSSFYSFLWSSFLWFTSDSLKFISFILLEALFLNRVSHCEIKW